MKTTTAATGTGTNERTERGPHLPSILLTNAHDVMTKRLRGEGSRT